jgi:hypothetical protein
MTLRSDLSSSSHETSSLVEELKKESTTLLSSDPWLYKEENSDYFTTFIAAIKETIEDRCDAFTLMQLRADILSLRRQLREDPSHINEVSLVDLTLLQMLKKQMVEIGDAKELALQDSCVRALIEEIESLKDMMGETTFISRAKKALEQKHYDREIDYHVLLASLNQDIKKHIPFRETVAQLLQDNKSSISSRANISGDDLIVLSQQTLGHIENRPIEIYYLLHAVELLKQRVEKEYKTSLNGYSHLHTKRNHQEASIKVFEQIQADRASLIKKPRLSLTVNVDNSKIALSTSAAAVVDENKAELSLGERAALVVLDDDDTAETNTADSPAFICRLSTGLFSATGAQGTFRSLAVSQDRVSRQYVKATRTQAKF